MKKVELGGKRKTEGQRDRNSGEEGKENKFLVGLMEDAHLTVAQPTHRLPFHVYKMANIKSDYSVIARIHLPLTKEN